MLEKDFVKLKTPIILHLPIYYIIMSVVTGGIVRKFYEGTLSNKIEYTSSAFWQVLLQRLFPENETYAVLCEYSPDASRRRCDITVLRYDDSHDTLSSLVWQECKPSEIANGGGNARDAEEQAADAARRCIKKENLLCIYAITTVGTTFRLWRVDKGNGYRPELKPSQYESYVMDQYISADSEDAWILQAFVKHVKEVIPLGDAPVVPSQAYLLSPPFGDTSGVSSMEEQGGMPWIDDFEPIGRGCGVWRRCAVASRRFGGGGRGVGNCGRGVGNSGRGISGHGRRTMPSWIKINANPIRPRTRPNEYIFTTLKNHQKSTRKDDWTETTYKKKPAWYYLYKGTHYYAREKP